MTGCKYFKRRNRNRHNCYEPTSEPYDEFPYFCSGTCLSFIQPQHRCYLCCAVEHHVHFDSQLHMGNIRCLRRVDFGRNDYLFRTPSSSVTCYRSTASFRDASAAKKLALKCMLVSKYKLTCFKQYVLLIQCITFAGPSRLQSSMEFRALNPCMRP